MGTYTELILFINARRGGIGAEVDSFLLVCPVKGYIEMGCRSMSKKKELH